MAEKSSTGLPKNTAAAVSYILGPITGIIILLLEKDPYVRFHAMQSTVVFIILFILQWVMTFTIILIPLVPLLMIIGFVLWLLLIYKAWQGERWVVPILGKYAEKMLKS